jgi:hypothetical protein
MAGECDTQSTTQIVRTKKEPGREDLKINFPLFNIITLQRGNTIKFEKKNHASLTSKTENKSGPPEADCETKSV